MNNNGLKLLLLCLMVAMCGFLKAQTLPQFSTDEQEYWYYIQFQRGSGVLEDGSSDKCVVFIMHS